MVNEKLILIKDLAGQLANAIEEYISSIDPDRVVIEKMEFDKIRHIGMLNSYLHVFDYNNGIVFSLPDSGDSYAYQRMHYNKLMSGELQRLVLNKRKEVYKSVDYIINYELEPLPKTKLYNLYHNS